MSFQSVTAVAPTLPDPGDGMRAIERRFLAMRHSMPDLRAALCSAYAHVGGSLAEADPRQRLLYEAGLAIAAAVDAEAARVARAGRAELPYHNRHHFVEATLAMGWLCAIARERGAISLHQAVLGVVAMVGHDYGHDGSWDQSGALEKLAADAIVAIAASVGVQAEDCLALRGVVMATALPLVRANKARAAELERAGYSQSGWAAMHLMASEADVLTSLMPGLGCRLGHALAAEWAGKPGSPPLDPSSFTGRITFLQLHDYLSDSAIELGLLRLYVSQVMAFRQVAVWYGATPRPEAGAALLDRLAPRRAVRAFAAAMLQTSSGRQPPVTAPIRTA